MEKLFYKDLKQYDFPTTDLIPNIASVFFYLKKCDEIFEYSVNYKVFIKFEQFTVFLYQLINCDKKHFDKFLKDSAICFMVSNYFIQAWWNQYVYKWWGKFDFNKKEYFLQFLKKCF